VNDGVDPTDPKNLVSDKAKAKLMKNPTIADWFEHDEDFIKKWADCQDNVKLLRELMGNDEKFMTCFKELTGVDVKTI
jgi:hypothetical protein